jgi:hypothetical protein
LHVPVRVVDVSNVGVGGVVVIDDRCVIDVGYGCGVDRGIADVDPVHILSAHVVTRYIDFTRTQREPSHIDSHPDASTSTNKNYQGRSVNRCDVNRSGYPAPTAADADPTAVMKWRVAPRRVVYPSPSPGSNPSPVAVVIRRPVRFHTIGIPDVTVIGVVTPVAVVIKVFITDHIGR